MLLHSTFENLNNKPWK